MYKRLMCILSHTNKTLTKGWSFLQPLRSSDKRVNAIPDISLKITKYI